MSTIVIELPDAIRRSLEAQQPELSRFALEAIALEGYRQEALSQRQVGELLGLNFWETEEFLKCHKAYLHYDEHDLEADFRAHERLLNRWSSFRTQVR